MASYAKDCEQCGASFVTDQPHRRKCFTCSPARIRPGGPTGVSPIRPDSSAPTKIVDFEPSKPRPPGRIEIVTRKELEELERLDTVEGALCEGLARGLDDPDLPGAQRTSMSKQLSAMMEDIRATAPREPDEVDRWAGIAVIRAREASGWTGA